MFSLNVFSTNAKFSKWISIKEATDENNNKNISFLAMSGNDENSEKSQEKNEELDITSEKFDPLKALYSKDLVLPMKNVKKLDNLGSFVSRLKFAGNDFAAEVKRMNSSKIS